MEQSKVEPQKDQWQLWQKSEYISLGWNELGDLTDINRSVFEQRQQKLAKEKGWKKNAMAQVWKFCKKMQEGDKIIVNQGSNKILAVATVAGPYYFSKEEEFQHCRSVKWDHIETKEVTEPSWQHVLMELKEKNKLFFMAQVVTYAEAKGCSEAILIYPADLPRPIDFKIGTIRVRNATFSLADNLEQAGKNFLKTLN